MDITELTVHELQEKIKNKELTITEITKAYVDRMNEKEKDVQAFITELKDEYSVEPPIANSSIFSFPKSIIFSAFIFSITVASYGDTKFREKYKPTFKK